MNNAHLHRLQKINSFEQELLEEKVKHIRIKQKCHSVIRPVTRSRKGVKPPRKIFDPPGKMYWTSFKIIGHSSKKLGPSQKTLRTSWCPKLVTGLSVINFCDACLFIVQFCVLLLNVGFLSNFHDVIGSISGIILHSLVLCFGALTVFLKIIEKQIIKKVW